MATIHYLIHGSWQGILALILTLIGLTLISFGQISVAHSNSSFSGGGDLTLSHRLIGCGFLISAILVVLITWFLGSKPITADEYEDLYTQVSQTPEVRPALKAFMLQHPHLTRIDYHLLERQFNNIKADIYIKKLTAEIDTPVAPTATV